MKSDWTITKLIASTSLGVLLMVLQLLPAAINMLAPTRTIAGPLTSLIYATMAVLCVLVVNKFGSATIMFTIYGILAIPFALLGTPGFILKVPVALVAGLIADILFMLGRRHTLAISLIIGGPILYYFAIAVVAMVRFFDMPGMEVASNMLFTPVAVIASFVVGAVGGGLGWLIYTRIESSNVVSRIQAK